MKKILYAFICFLGFALGAHATTITVSGTNIQDANGLPLATGQWCFNSTCLTVTNGAFTGTVTAGTSTVTVLNASSATILTITPVALSANINWNGFIVAQTISYSGAGEPYMACQLSALYTQTDSTPSGVQWTCISASGRLVWTLLGPPTPVGPGFVSGYGPPTGVEGVVPTLYQRTDSQDIYSLFGNTGSISTTWYQLAGSGFTNPMTGVGDLIQGGSGGAAVRVAGALGINSTPFIFVETPASYTVPSPGYWQTFQTVLNGATVLNATLQYDYTTVNGQTCTLGSTCTVTTAAASITVGTTTIASGTSGRIEFNNGGVLGEKAVTGTGNVVLAATPSISDLTVTSSFTATGLVTNADLANDTTTVNGQPCALGGTCTITASAATLTVLSTGITGGTSAGLLYNAAGTLGNLATANNGVLVTSSGGVPSISSTLPTGLTAPNYTVTGSFTATGLVTNGDLANDATTVNGQSCALGSTCTVSAVAATITVGTTTIASGTNGYIEFNNSGVLGEKATTGSGNVVLASSPSISALTVTSSFTATGLVTNADLVNASTTVNGQSCVLGSTCTVTAAASSITNGVTTVNSGTANGVFFDSAGVIGQIIPASNSVLIGNGSGIPSFSFSLPDAVLETTFRNSTWNITASLCPNAILVASASTDGKFGCDSFVTASGSAMNVYNTGGTQIVSSLTTTGSGTKGALNLWDDSNVLRVQIDGDGSAAFTNFVTGKTVAINPGTTTGIDLSSLKITSLANGTNPSDAVALGQLGTAAFVNTGTSGATIPLLNGTNTWSALQTINAGLTVTGQIISESAFTLGTASGGYILGTNIAGSVNEPITIAGVGLGQGSTLNINMATTYVEGNLGVGTANTGGVADIFQAGTSGHIFFRNSSGYTGIASATPSISAYAPLYLDGSSVYLNNGSGGAVATKNNVLDDGSGNSTFQVANSITNTVAVPVSSPTTVLTLPSLTAAAYVVSCNYPNSGLSSTFGTMQMITTSLTGAVSAATVLSAASVSISYSGLNLQVTQTYGGTLNIKCSALNIQ